MCRDGYNVECAELGCDGRVTCRHESGMCPAHGFDRWLDEADDQ